MQSPEVMLLSQREILDLQIPMKKIIDLTEEGFREFGNGRVENPPKPGIHATPESFIHAMPSLLRDLDIGGIKWVSGYYTNRELDLPATMGLIILNDMETGAPLCIMDGTWITAIRTAAVSAVTAKYCATKDASVLGVVGAGVQGWFHLLAIKEVVSGLSKVKIFDINPAAAEKYQTELGSQTGLDIEICQDVEKVAIGSDIIITATQRLPAPLIKNEWFKAGALGVGLEASRAWYGDVILGVDKFITDSWKQTKSFHAQGAFPDGLPQTYTELGKIVSGRSPGRENSQERILAISIGIACVDLIIADYIYRQAKTGTNRRFWEFL